jgi:hypothetical protein
MFSNAYVVWAADDLSATMEHQIRVDDADSLRRLQQRVDGADLIWKSWTMANDGSVLSCGNGQGSLTIPAEKLSDLPRFHKQYAGAIDARVAVGVGTKLSDAQKALEAAKLRGGGQIVLYTPDIDAELEAKKKKPGDIADVLAQDKLDESAVQKSELRKDDDEYKYRRLGMSGYIQPHQNVTILDAKPGFAHTGVGQVSKPGVVLSVHAQPETFVDKTTTSFVDVRDETTGKTRRFHQYVNRPAVSGDGGPEKQPGQPTGLWGELMFACGDVGERFPRESWAQEPCACNQCTRCKGSGWMWYGSSNQLDHKPFVHPDAMAKAQPAQNEGAGAGFGGFSRGTGAAPPAPPMSEASEHSEAEALMGQMNDPERPAAPEMTHAAQDLETKFHALAAQQDVKDAQDAQEQQVDVNSVKGAIVSMLQQVRGQSAVFGRLKQTDPDAYNAFNALVQGVIAMAHTIEGMSQQQLQKAEELVVAAGRSMRALLADSLLQENVSLEKSGNRLPMPKAPTHKDLELPVGTVKQGGPTGNAHGDVGKMKVQHGDGSTSWKQMRAGQVTAVADRHASPIGGHASHPTSSRNPLGKADMRFTRGGNERVTREELHARQNGSVDHLRVGQRFHFCTSNVVMENGVQKVKQKHYPCEVTKVHVDEEHPQGPRVYALTVRDEVNGVERVFTPYYQVCKGQWSSTKGYTRPFWKWVTGPGEAVDGKWRGDWLPDFEGLKQFHRADGDATVGRGKTHVQNAWLVHHEILPK